MKTSENQSGSGMGFKIGTVVILAIAIIAVFAIKNIRKDKGPVKSSNKIAVNSNDREVNPVKTAPMPKILDLGAGKCIPCKMMAPILEELKKEYSERLIVDFIDVWKNPDAATPYNINIIPTQIFFSPEGKELFRHVGFYSKEDILNKWKELGYDFQK